MRLIRPALALSLSLLTFPALALPPPPEPDSPELAAIKSEYMDMVQKELNVHTAYIGLQQQIGRLQATIQTDEAELAQMKKEAKSDRPAGTVAGGDSGQPAK